MTCFYRFSGLVSQQKLPDIASVYGDRCDFHVFRCQIYLQTAIYGRFVNGSPDCILIICSGQGRELQAQISLAVQCRQICHEMTRQLCLKTKRGSTYVFSAFSQEEYDPVSFQRARYGARAGTRSTILSIVLFGGFYEV